MEAQVLITHLKDEDIDAIIEKDDAGGMHPQLQAARGVKILVKDIDIEKAKKIIDTKEQNSLNNWTCKKCGEIHEGQFKVCWNCGESSS